ncbi:MAG: adenine phosphoribosyltransferase, partial [Acidimicrobiales bacterium]
MGVDGLRERIREVPDYPKAGVSFKDITPLLADANAFAACVDALSDAFSSHGVDKVVSIEARGFIVAATVAIRLGAG